MTYRGKQIAFCLLLGFLLAPPVLNAQDTAPELGVETNGAPSLFPSPIDVDMPVEPPARSSKYFATQWRNWTELGQDAQLTNGARPAPYVDTCFDCPDDHPWFFEGGLIALQRERWEGGSFL